MATLHRFTPQIMLVLGFMILLVSYFGDSLGIGNPASGFGPRQFLGALFGIILIVSGISIWALRDRNQGLGNER